MQPKLVCFGHEISMAEFKPDPKTIHDGVYILSEAKNDFESVYLKVREKEKRIYSDAELLILPFASNSNPHKKEWSLRTKSFKKFTKYLQTKKNGLNILDLGCGNGWCSGQLSKFYDHYYYCIDLNLTELKLGSKNFKSKKLKFIYADIFSVELPVNFFDIVIINAAVQYFPDFKKLINGLLILLTEKGEIHIIDSPFYSADEAVKAKQRSLDYYSSMNYPEMANNYFHHTWNGLKEFDYKILHNPSTFMNRFKKILIEDSPFPWIGITK